MEYQSQINDRTKEVLALCAAGEPFPRRLFCLTKLYDVGPLDTVNVAGQVYRIQTIVETIVHIKAKCPRWFLACGKDEIKFLYDVKGLTYIKKIAPVLVLKKRL